jgi:hypothetical protein
LSPAKADPSGGRDDVLVARYLPEVASVRDLIPATIHGVRVIAVAAARTRPQ